MKRLLYFANFILASCYLSKGTKTRNENSLKDCPLEKE